MSATAQRIARPVAAAPVAVTLTGWALLTMDGVTLALPQKDIVTIELTTALQPAEDGGDAIGWLAHDTQRWPVYCLDRRFALAAALAASARVCVLFRSYLKNPLSPKGRGNITNELSSRTLGLAGTQVSLLAADADLGVQPLPACLATSGSPLTGLALHHDQIVMSLHANALAEYLTRFEAAHGD